jgi:hypothetical protein
MGMQKKMPKNSIGNCNVLTKFPGMAKKKKISCEEYKEFLRKKIGQSRHILREKSLKFPYLDNIVHS